MDPSLCKLFGLTSSWRDLTSLTRRSVNSLALSKASNLLYTGGEDGFVRVLYGCCFPLLNQCWDTRSVRQPVQQAFAADGVNRIGLSRITDSLCVPSDDGSVRLFDRTMERVGTLRAPKGQVSLDHHFLTPQKSHDVQCAVWSTNEDSLITAGFIPFEIVEWRREITKD
jgi:hypothetical protein